MGYLFISDLHLSSARPRPLDRFLSFLETRAPCLQALYILGDLFDQWLGDDDITPPHPDVLERLSELTRRGIPCFALHGNHDFLLGKGFEAASGCRLLPDPTLARICGTLVLLSHGDGLCTDDVEYQQWRAYSRSRENQRAFLALPLATRSAQAANLRLHINGRAQLKPLEIMDVNPAAVKEALRAHGVRHLIHGHTHRPGIHHLNLDGESAARVVLGDWYEEETVLWWDSEGYRLGSLAGLGL